LKLFFKLTGQMFSQFGLLQAGCFFQSRRNAGNPICGEIGGTALD
jgi:hypothetical protein